MARLAIADPPYLGRAEMLYGERRTACMNANATARIAPIRKARDPHPHADPRPARRRRARRTART